MITFITGAPGAGKSAAVVSMLAELGKDRPVYVNGIADLKIDHLPLTDAEVLDWPNTVPDGSCIVIDEVQRLWRPRGAGTKVPPEIQALETHRHRGLDFYIISQKPSLCDKNIRDLTGRHVHLRDIGLLGRWWYEWPEIADNCSASWKNAPIKKRYRLPKSIFGQYKSASIHVKPVRSVPWMVFVLGGALLGTSYLGWLAYGAVSSKMSPVASPAALTTAGVSTVLPVARASTQLPKSSGFNLAAFVPVVSAFPESAPAYDDLRVVTTMRRLVAGWCAGESCECRDNQGIVLDLPKGVCNEFVQKGRFDPYRVQPDDSNRESRFTSAQPKNDQL